MVQGTETTIAAPHPEGGTRGFPVGEVGPDLLARLTDDLVSTSVLVAVFASQLNARAAGRAVIGDGPTLRQLPPPPTDTLMETLLGPDLPLELADRCSLELVRERYCVARKEAETTLAGCDDGIAWAPLARLWRQVAAALAAALEIAFRLEGLYGPLTVRYRKETLLRLLAATSAGRTPCLGGRGEIVVPGWIERRREQRITLLVPVTLVRRDSRERAATIDVSRSGLGLVGVTGGIVGESIAVEMEQGRQLDGYVTWIHDDRLGLRLTTPLPASDPLLVGGCP